MTSGTRHKELLDYTVSYKAVWTGLANTPTASFVLAYKVNAPH